MTNSKNTITPKQNQELISEKSLSTIEERLINGETLSEILKDNQFQCSLMKFYHYLKKNPEIENKILEARKLGVQTLIDKLLQIFSYQEVESPNEILWIREKAKFVQWVAGKITDLYSDNKTIKQDIDTKMTISWDDGNDLIDVSAEDVSTPTEVKD